MTINSLEKVTFRSQLPPNSPPGLEKTAPFNSITSSSRASMRRMKASETMAVAFRETALPKTIGEVDFSKNKHVDTNVTVKTAYYVAYNEKYGNSWVMHNYSETEGISFFGIWVMPGNDFIETKIAIDKDFSKTYTLVLNHLSALCEGKLLAKITIEVNGKVVKAGHSPNNGNYITEQFDITEYVINGNNAIKLKFDKDSYSSYWINHLSVLES